MTEDILDDPEALAAADRGGMLRAVATGGAQIRAAWRTAAESDLERVADEGRPRALVLAGVGGSGQAGALLLAVAGAGGPVPVVIARGPQLPGWVGPMDLVCALSCSGRTQETLAVAAEASRRGARLAGIGSARSPLADLTAATRGSVFIPVDAGGRPPRLNLWSLALPLLAVGAAADLLVVVEQDVTAAADRLDSDAEHCGPLSSLVVNPAKALAAELVGSLPMIWGSGEAGCAAAPRFAGQLHENAKLPAVVGTLPEAAHGQIVAWDGPFGGPTSRSEEDLFRDGGEVSAYPRLHLVLLRDEVEDARIAAQADAAAEVAAARGVGLSVLRGTGAGPLERIASLVGVSDFASVYAALAAGQDPVPIGAITELKERVPV